MPNFVSFAASIAELAHGEKSHTQSPGLFDAPGTEALALRKMSPDIIRLILFIIHEIMFKSI